MRSIAEDRTEILNIGGVVVSGAYKFTCNVGIRFGTIQAILNKTGLVPKEDINIPTVVIPLHLLTPSQLFFEWTCASKDDTLAAPEKFARKCKPMHFHFVSDFGSISAIEAELRKPNAE